VDAETAIWVESHEAEVWSRLVAATGEVPGDPLAARVNRSLSVPLPALTIVNFGLFNRVIGLGVASPTSPAELDHIIDWYGTQGQTDYWIEVTPASLPVDLADLLVARGLADTGRRQSKVCRRPASLPVDRSVEVVELAAADRENFAAVNVAAWVAPGMLAAWFGATFGADGFRHFGVRDGDRLVATGAMFVSGSTAWVGFGATLPGFRRRGLQTALLSHRVTEAAAMGCDLVHAETSADTVEHPNSSLHNLLRLGFTQIYEKAFFAPARKS
jgi:GNAT superfamily N-acetyltransferase